MIKFIFAMQVNLEVFYKLKLSFWVCVATHAQSAKKRSLDISAISPKSIGDDVFFFLPADKYNSFLQYDSITSGLRSLACSKYPKH